MEPELETLLQQFDAIREDAEALTANLTDAQFVWKPGAKKWSIIECIAHLVLVDGTELPIMRATIADARSKGITGHGPFRYGVMSGWFANSMEPPVKRFKVSAPGGYLPKPVANPGDTLKQFFAMQYEIQDLIRSSDGLDLAKVKTRLPIGPGLKMSLGRRFQLLAAHDRRHLWQARQVLGLNP